MQSRNDKIQPYSFLLCILVVIIHNPTKAYFSYDGRLVERISHCITNDVFPAITTVAVPSFFILSSFLFYRNYTYSKTKEKLFSRINSLVVPYLFWNVISLGIEMLTKIPAIAVYSVDTSNPFLPLNILCGIFLHKYNVFWFVFALIIYNLFCGFFYFVFKNKCTGLLALFVVLILYAFQILVIKLPNGCYFQTDSILYYLIGCYLGIHHKDLWDLKFTVLQRFMATIILMIAIGIDILMDNEGLVVQFILIFFRCVTLWISLGDSCDKIEHKWWMGITFFIYATHSIVGRMCSTVLRIVFAKMFPQFVLTEIIVFVLSVIMTIVICIGVAYLWKRVSNKTFLIVTGNRV